MTGAGAVGGLVVDEFAQGAEGVRGGLGAGGEGGVDLGDAAPDQSERVGVDGEVVDALVPPVAVVGEAEEGLGDQGALGEVDGPGEVGGRPGLGLGVRSLGGAQVDPVQRPRAVGLAPLGGGAVPGGGHQGQGLGLGDGPAQGPLEQLLVQGPVDLHAVAGVVDRVVGGESLGVQDAGLRGEQRQFGGILDLVVTHRVGTPGIWPIVPGHTGNPRCVSLGKPKLFSDRL